MKEFFQLISSDEFRSHITQFNPLGLEHVKLADSLGRILGKDIVSPEHLPPFARSTMDGYAVRARDTFGCSESEPTLLKIAGEIAMGESGQTVTLETSQTCTIWTGGELPHRADAVVMVEFTSELDKHNIEIFRPVAPGENVIQPGEDYSQDQLVLEKCHQLRPQDLGVLAGLGITEVHVFKRPIVAIISTGDELVSIDQTLPPGKIRDINTTTLTALVTECGGIPFPLGIIADNQESIRDACIKALDNSADIILLSGGSSVGMRDYTLKVLESIEKCELLAHGVSIKPGKPTILGKKENVALFGLPGHVGSAIVVFHLFVRPMIGQFMGNKGIELRRIQALTAEQIPSVIGREDYIRVLISWGNNGNPNRATPVYGKSGLLNPLVKADGLLVIDRDTEGLDKGEQSVVLLFP